MRWVGHALHLAQDLLPEGINVPSVLIFLTATPSPKDTVLRGKVISEVRGEAACPNVGWAWGGFVGL